MTDNELAALLTGREYRSEITKAEAAQAKEDGLVVVFGASDDLIEFRGAIDDETGHSECNKIFVDRIGVLEVWDDGSGANKEYAREWFSRESKTRRIKAFWDKEDPYSWTFKTEIPHETFEIVEDGKPFCRGIIFSLKELP